jgi:hypothetical protein
LDLRHTANLESSFWQIKRANYRQLGRAVTPYPATYCLHPVAHPAAVLVVPSDSWQKQQQKERIKPKKKLSLP